ncbi:MAG TPA: AMP-binding protein, partial [Acidimicrobiia bacterium]
MSDGETLRGDLEFQTIPRLVETAAERWPDADAIVDVDAGVRRTYAEFADDVLHAARAFTASGIRPGDRVAVW